MKHLIPISLLLCSCLTYAQTRPVIERPGIPQPDQTLLYAQRDTCDLLLDFYTAAPGAGPCADTLRKPVIVHVFGGASSPASATTRTTASGSAGWPTPATTWPPSTTVWG